MLDLRVNETKESNRCLKTVNSTGSGFEFKRSVKKEPVFEVKLGTGKSRQSLTKEKSSKAQINSLAGSEFVESKRVKNKLETQLQSILAGKKDKCASPGKNLIENLNLVLRNFEKTKK